MSFSLESSQFSLTKPPSGNQFKVYSVQSLSVKSFLAFGGIPSQNSITLTQNFLAMKKCPNS